MTTRNRRLEPDPARDWSSRAGAEALAEEIRRFWAGFGHLEVRVWIEPARGGPQSIWAIRSCMKGGLLAMRFGQIADVNVGQRGDLAVVFGGGV
jgi:hypothetical protein